MSEQSEPLVSIVVPVYKVAPLLDKCVASLVSQTYENIEVFLVDDGSPDESPAKCDAWAGRDQRVNVIHKKNEGVSVARNTGLDAARGKYVWFVDGDDYVAVNAVQELVKRAEYTHADIVFCSNYDSVFANGVYTEVRHNQLLDFDAETNAEFIDHFAALSDAQYVCPPWNKMFRRSFLLSNEGRFTPGVFVGQDSLFNFPLYAKAHRVSCVPQSLYYYVVRSGSAVSSFNVKWFGSRKLVHSELLPTIKKWNPGYLNTHRNRLIMNVSIILGAMYAGQKKCIGRDRRQLVSEITHDSILRECVSNVKPKGIRNGLTKIVLSTRSSICIVLYGRVLGMLKKVKRALRKR